MRARPAIRALRGPVTLLVVAGLAVGFVLGPAAGTHPAARADSSPQERLTRARQQLDRIAEQVRAAGATAEGAEAALADADATLRAVEQVVNDIAEAVERQHTVVADTTARLRAVEDEAAELEEAFHDRVSRLFKQGPVSSLELLLTGGPADEALARTLYLQQVTRTDQVGLEQLESARVVVAAERRRVAAEERRLERLLAEQQEVLAEVTELRESRALAAAEAREQLRLLVEEKDDLEEEQRELEALIRRQQEEARRRQLEEERRRAAARRATASSGTTSGAVGASGYAWPICARVTSEYGMRWGRLHAGIDQGARTGTRVGAAKAGEVIYAGWRGGYGRLVLIDHHDGVVTAYAHLSRFAVGVGARVSQGQVIGHVGTSGNSTGPHLHTEFRVNGRAVNPRQYLPARPC